MCIRDSVIDIAEELDQDFEALDEIADEFATDGNDEQHLSLIHI